MAIKVDDKQLRKRQHASGPFTACAGRAENAEMLRASRIENRLMDLRFIDKFNINKDWKRWHHG